MNCGAEGAFSLLGLVPAGQVAGTPGGDPHEPMLVHVTVCRNHMRGVRAWMRARMHPEDEPVSARTSFLMDHWQQAVGQYDVPVWSGMRAHA